ncbi:Flp family type IVb pilin [Spongiibacter sp. KMU-158]|uniref:Flp family type IVb pilin n=1 Tax=Spongiibacter pelagi TaxID=2760804 RepID=A0A927GVB1_9GAMM|nr:Flp family type IVb pilin [Spongiibacter pelagi]MBD2858481.1 Flp family type IVb pilin [Spongiibacter pelagi]
MKTILNKLTALKNDERGASAIEYAVMAAILVVVIAFAISLLGAKDDTTKGMGKSFNDIATKMNP